MDVICKDCQRITVEGREFLWKLVPAGNHMGDVLHITSPDKRFLVQYTVGQDHIAVRGDDFARASLDGQSWRRFTCPTWSLGVRPSREEVESIIAWCLTAGEASEVDWRGRPLAP